MKSKRTVIPPEEFGPGSRLDGPANTLYGASGKVYTDLKFTKAEFEKLCDLLKLPRPPDSYYNRH